MPLPLRVWQLPEGFKELGATAIYRWLVLAADRPPMGLPRGLHTGGHRQGVSTLAYQLLNAVSDLCFIADLEPTGATFMREFHRQDLVADLELVGSAQLFASQDFCAVLSVQRAWERRL